MTYRLNSGGRSNVGPEKRLRIPRAAVEGGKDNYFVRVCPASLVLDISISTLVPPRSFEKT